MSKNCGYIAIFRDIFDHWIWKEKPFSKGQAWIDLLLLAQYNDSEKKPYKDRVITYQRGKVYKSELYLAKRWGWNRKTVKKFLKQLENDGMLTGVWTTQGTTLTLVNYDFYQNPSLKYGQRDGQRSGQRRDSAMDNGMDNKMDNAMDSAMDIHNKNKINKRKNEKEKTASASSEVGSAADDVWWTSDEIDFDDDEWLGGDGNDE